MKAKLILAEAATAHPDGTVSILRAGINKVVGSKPPFNLQATLIVSMRMASRCYRRLPDSSMREKAEETRH